MTHAIRHDRRPRQDRSRFSRKHARCRLGYRIEGPRWTAGFRARRVTAVYALRPRLAIPPGAA